MTEEFDLDKYRLEHPMDYMKAISLICVDPSNPIISKTIYQITRLHIPDKIFKYYSLSNNPDENSIKFNTLMDKKIYLANSKSMNDPFEGKAFYYHNKKLTKFDVLKPHNGRLIDDFSKFHLLSSFTKNGINCMPMWAHYANNHQGYCVEYDTKHPYNQLLRSSLFPVQYTDERIDITPIMEQNIIEFLHAKEIAKEKKQKEIIIDNLSLVWLGIYYSCLKHSSWQYENEFRVIIASNSPVAPYMDALPSAIYVGVNCSELNKKHLFDIAYMLNIPFYLMEFDEYSMSYELTAKEIKS